MTRKMSSKFLASFYDPTRPACHDRRHTGEKGGKIASNASKEKIICERNKRLVTWMANVLNIDRSDRRTFFDDRMQLFANATDDQIAQTLLDQIPSLVFMENLDDAKKLVGHFQAIAEGWFSDITSC